MFNKLRGKGGLVRCFNRFCDLRVSWLRANRLVTSPDHDWVRYCTGFHESLERSHPVLTRCRIQIELMRKSQPKVTFGVNDVSCPSSERRLMTVNEKLPRRIERKAAFRVRRKVSLRVLARNKSKPVTNSILIAEAWGVNEVGQVFDGLALQENVSIVVIIWPIPNDPFVSVVTSFFFKLHSLETITFSFFLDEGIVLEKVRTRLISTRIRLDCVPLLRDVVSTYACGGGPQLPNVPKRFRI
mmetsp:Transcript_22463/g.42189  ORF Transcript_22463/g.42189 Transcript_22463/m.42189 type:complete len:242 (-) Transcript_22463:528-1253(-)